MKKAGKIIIIVITVCFIISIASSIYLLKNKDEIISGVNEEVIKLNEEASQIMEQVTILTSENNGENTTEQKTTKVTENITATTGKETTRNNIDEKELNCLVGKPLEEFIIKVNQLGYKATYLAEGEDFTSFIEDMADLYLTGELEIDTENKTVVVTLVSESKLEWQKKKEELKEKLDPYYAWKAVEEYGILEYYGYDFKLHYITGKIAEEIDDENTWFLKATCSIAGLKKTCEAKVTGTTANPVVVDFYIYNS